MHTVVIWPDYWPPRSCIHADARNAATTGQGSKVNIGAIVGGVLGALVLIGLTAAVVLYIRRQRGGKAGKQQGHGRYMPASPMGSAALPSYTPYGAAKSTAASSMSGGGGGGGVYGAGVISPLGTAASGGYAASANSAGSPMTYVHSGQLMPAMGPSTSVTSSSPPRPATAVI